MSAIVGALIGVSALLALLSIVFLLLAFRYREIAKSARATLHQSRDLTRKQANAIATIGASGNQRPDGIVCRPPSWLCGGSVDDWLRARERGINSLDSENILRLHADSRLSVIADPVFFAALSAVANVSAVHRKHFVDEIRDQNPDVVLLVWPLAGINLRGHSWSFLEGQRSATNPAPWQTVREVLDFCTCAGIPTAFWMPHGEVPAEACPDFWSSIDRFDFIFTHRPEKSGFHNRNGLLNRSTILGCHVDTARFHPIGRTTDGEKVLDFSGDVESSLMTSAALVGAGPEFLPSRYSAGEQVEPLDYWTLPSALRSHDYVSLPKPSMKGLAELELQAGACGAIPIGNFEGIEAEIARREGLIRASRQSFTYAVRTILRATGVDINIEQDPVVLLDVVDSYSSISERAKRVMNARPGYRYLAVVERADDGSVWELPRPLGGDLSAIPRRAFREAWSSERLVGQGPFYVVGELDELAQADFLLLTACLSFPVAGVTHCGGSEEKFGTMKTHVENCVMIPGNLVSDLLDGKNIGPILGV